MTMMAGTEAENPTGSELLDKQLSLVTLVICHEFLSLNDFRAVFQIYEHKHKSDHVVK